MASLLLVRLSILEKFSLLCGGHGRGVLPPVCHERRRAHTEAAAAETFPAAAGGSRRSSRPRHNRLKNSHNQSIDNCLRNVTPLHVSGTATAATTVPKEYVRQRTARPDAAQLALPNPYGYISTLSIPVVRPLKKYRRAKSGTSGLPHGGR
jgi:hypothetical protein